MVYSFSFLLTAIFPFEFQGRVREIDQREGIIGRVISGPSFLVCAMGDSPSMKRLMLLSFYLEQKLWQKILSHERSVFLLSIQWNSDTICLEIVSDSTDQGLSPTRLLPPPPQLHTHTHTHTHTCVCALVANHNPMLSPVLLTNWL